MRTSSGAEVGAMARTATEEDVRRGIDKTTERIHQYRGGDKEKIRERLRRDFVRQEQQEKDKRRGR